MQHEDNLSGTYFPWHWRNLKPVLERASKGQGPNDCQTIEPSLHDKSWISLVKILKWKKNGISIWNSFRIKIVRNLEGLKSRIWKKSHSSCKAHIVWAIDYDYDSSRMTNIWDWQDILQYGTLRYLNGYKNQSVCCKSLTNVSSCPVSCVGLLTSSQDLKTCFLFLLINPNYATILLLRIISLIFFLDLVATILTRILSKYYKTFLMEIWKMDF